MGEAVDDGYQLNRERFLNVMIGKIGAINSIIFFKNESNLVYLRHKTKLV